MCMICVFVDMHAPHKYSFSRKEKVLCKEIFKKVLIPNKDQIIIDTICCVYIQDVCVFFFNSI